MSAGRAATRAATHAALSAVMLAPLLSCARDSAPATRAASVCVEPDGDAWEPAPVGAATFEVNRGTQGMSSQLRWLLSPDSAAILVIDDPHGVESEPVPDAVFYATERTGRTWRMDSVWSAAPSPDWRYVAVGRALVIGGGQEQRVPASAWNAPAQRLRELARYVPGDTAALSGDSLRAHAYAVSGMAVIEGAAATLVLKPSELPDATPRFVSLDGWRVSWSCDARSILIGEKPTLASDDAPAATTRREMLDAGGTTNARPEELEWSEGPVTTIGVSTATQARTLEVRGRSIESRGGRVLVRQSGDVGTAVEHDVGPGVPLAATRGGHFILALAPRTPGSRDASDHAVVYRVP